MHYRRWLWTLHLMADGTLFWAEIYTNGEIGNAHGFPLVLTHVKDPNLRGALYRRLTTPAIVVDDLRAGSVVKLQYDEFTERVAGHTFKTLNDNCTYIHIGRPAIGDDGFYMSCTAPDVADGDEEHKERFPLDTDPNVLLDRLLDNIEHYMEIMNE